MKIKVLPLMFPFNGPKKRWLNCMDSRKKIEPIFNRNGYYYDRIEKKVWWEIDGEAWLDNRTNDFLWTFELLNTKILRNKELDAIETLMNERLASKEQTRLHYMNIHYWMLVFIKRRAVQSRIKILGK